MVTLAGTAKSKKKKLAVTRRPFANHVTPESVQLHAMNHQVRIERRKKEHANQYRLEYNNIVGMVYKAGATAQNLHAIATRNFVAMHGERHLPK